MNIKRRYWWMYILIFLVSQLTAVAVTFGVTWIGHNRQLATTEWTMVAALFAANVLGILLWLCYRPTLVTWKSTMSGVRGEQGLRTKLSFGLALPVIVLVNLIQETFFPEIPDLVGDATFRAIMYNPVGLFTVAAIGPICEELLFRGGIQHCLHQNHSSQGPAVAIGLSAILFSLIHMNPAQMPAALVLGLVLGFAYWWSGSLIAPVCIHVFNNSFACMMALLSPDDDSFVQFLGGTQGAVIAAVISVFWLYLMLHLIRREMRKATEKP